MKKIVSIFILFFFLVSITSCATTNPDGTPNTAATTAIGAAAGGLIAGTAAYVITGDAKKALVITLVGATAGALTGFIIGKQREKTLKTADQIYKEKPNLAKTSAKNNPPEISSFRPCVRDLKTERELNAVKKGEKVELGSEYEIHIPKYSTVKEVKVVEYNTLISSDGKKMDHPELTRLKPRPCEAIRGGVEVTIPQDLPSGKYTHVATLKLGDKEYKKEQQIVVL